jgi:hypothetical protein
MQSRPIRGTTQPEQSEIYPLSELLVQVASMNDMQLVCNQLIPFMAVSFSRPIVHLGFLVVLRAGLL